MNSFLKSGLAALLLSSANVGSAQYVTEVSQSLQLWVPPVNIKADGTTITKMYVCEKNDVNYSSFNMTFIVPDGIRVAMVAKGNVEVEDCEMSVRSADHIINCGQPNATTIKVIGYSPTIQSLYPDDQNGNPADELFYIGLVADAQMAPGDYQVEIVDVKFVLENADAHILSAEPLHTSISVTDDASGVEEIAVEDVDADAEWYDLTGHRVNANPSTPGIYIVRQGNKVSKTIVH